MKYNITEIIPLDLHIFLIAVYSASLKTCSHKTSIWIPKLIIDWAFPFQQIQERLASPPQPPHLFAYGDNEKLK